MIHPRHAEACRSHGGWLLLAAVPLLLLLLLPGTLTAPLPMPWFGLGITQWHTLVESVSMLVCGLVTVVAWNARELEIPESVHVLGIACAGSLVIDYVHTQSFLGMANFVTPNAPSKATLLFMASRLLMASALIAVALRPWHVGVEPRWTRWFGIATAAYVVGVLIWALGPPGDVPVLIFDGMALSPLKVIGDCALTGLFVAAALISLHRLREPQSYDAATLAAAAAAMALGQLVFTLFVRVTDLMLVLGHAYKVLGFWLVYQAIVADSIRAPFQRLAASRERERASEDERRAITEAIPALIAAVDRDGTYRFANSNHARWLGVEPAQMIGRRVDEVLARAHRADLQAAIALPLRRAMAGEATSVDCRVAPEGDGGQNQVGKDEGGPDDGLSQLPDRWLDVSCVPQRDAGGRVIGVLLLAHDITDRKRTEAALGRSEERLQLVLRGSTDASWDWDLLGNDLFYSARWWEMLGYAVDELPNDAALWNRLMHPDDAARTAQVFGGALSGGQAAYDVEFRLLHKLGHYVPVLSRGFISRDGAGNAIRVSGVNTDLSERRRAEAALLAMKTAERANAAKTEFLSHMSHELRTPLNAVIGFAQLLCMDERQALTPQQARQVRHIEDAGAHLLAMIGDVLDLSRIESGQMTLSPEQVMLDKLVGEAVSLVHSALPDSGIEIRVDPPGDPAAGLVQADHVRLRQVLVNLLSNAVKYNRPGGGVQVHWQRLPGDTVQLCVDDDGPGLTDEQRAHLFEPFNRLGAERRSVEGTGIGLVITQRLLQMMGGGIGVESQPGTGSRFVVTLPAAQGAIGSMAGVPDASRQGPVASVGARLLVYAEDNPINVELVKAVLAMRPQWRLLAAPSGQQALTLVRREAPDLLLLDMHLGDMGGLDVLRGLRGDPAADGLDCVALSADAMPSSVDAAIRAGVRAYLTKPIDVNELLACLDSVGGTTRVREMTVP